MFGWIAGAGKALGLGTGPIGWAVSVALTPAIGFIKDTWDAGWALAHGNTKMAAFQMKQAFGDINPGAAYALGKVTGDKDLELSGKQGAKQLVSMGFWGSNDAKAREAAINAAYDAQKGKAPAGQETATATSAAAPTGAASSSDPGAAPASKESASDQVISQRNEAIFKKAPPKPLVDIDLTKDPNSDNDIQPISGRSLAGPLKV